MASAFSSRVSVADLFEQLHDELQLSWVAGRAGGQRSLEVQAVEAADENLSSAYANTQVGHLNFIHPNWVQVLGAEEMQYLQASLSDASGLALDHVFVPSLMVLIIVEEQAPFPALLQKADAMNMPVFTSPLAASQLIVRLQHWLSRALADRETRHGVFMDVLGMGVLLLGEAGIGKSELALELLSHGHRLIADDAVEFVRTAPEVVVGNCPPAIHDHLEVRGLGIINIRDMFGAAAILRSKRLRLAVELKRMTVADMAAIDRLRGMQSSLNVLGVEIPQITLPVTPGRNLAVMVEVAARSQFLKESGVDTLAQFEAQIKRTMEKNDQS